MKDASPVVIARKDYCRPNWTIEQTDLTFELEPQLTVVTSVLHLRQVDDGPLQLDGSDVKLVSISVDGEPLDKNNYTLSENSLLINSLPKQCQVQIVTHIVPNENTALEGLYCSGGHLTTQCEAEGFRKITYYLDRPDALSIFNVTLIGDKNAYPVMLSNGNLVSSEELSKNQNKVVWHDPHPKPCYLFALVAGQLSRIEDSFTTSSNRVVDLHIYTEKHNLDQCDFAMDALKRSMKWDEDVYGLEYDLDLFMIVVVDDFNAGAMENKGLNIFNSKYVLADSALATDNDFLGVEAVIAHEYFHNWSGNRVTCRDWFQLSLKEGLTVFRDQQFSADMRSANVKRIQDVKMLRAQQFAEDAGPMAHPIRPDEYIEINNFYTLTVYEKGAEVIRMIHTLLGEELYHKGIDLYFARHDGQAVTCDDFVQAMQDASGVDLTVFRQWYSQSGTPKVSVTDTYDAATKQYTLHVEQMNPSKTGERRAPLHIPMRVGLLDNNGKSLNIELEAGQNITADTDNSVVVHLTQSSQSYQFNNIESKPVPSLLRGFCAPVTLDYDYGDDELALLLAYDSDSFNRWEAGQRLATRMIDQWLDKVDAAGLEAVSPLEVPVSFLDAFESLLNDASLDAGYKSLVLELPGVKTIGNNRRVINPQAIDNALNEIKIALANRYEPLLKNWITTTPKRDDANSIGPRMLANAALGLLSVLPAERWVPLAVAQYDSASNMTDRVAALSVLCDEPGEAKSTCLADFYERYASHKLVVDKWFSLQASAHTPQVLNDVNALMDHSAFSIENPNRLRSLIGAFSNANPVYFHSHDGGGYELLSSMVIKLDGINAQVAARLVAPFLQWRRYVEPQQQLMHAQLSRIAAVETLSPAVYEIVNKALNDH